jgi:RHS repeat-associated protein
LGTGYAVSSDVAGAFTNPELEIVNYYDNYDFIGRNLTGTMPTVTVNDSQKQYACGFQTGQVVYATNGEALGSVNVYDQKGQMVRTVRKGLKGYLEDVSTDYTFTGDVENTVADVDVKYGSHFNSETGYIYERGKKTSMTLSVSHGQTPKLYETEYVYDAVGRLSGKERHMAGKGKSSCSYTYDVHGWLTGINSGRFHEQLFYTDGLDGGYYNGNISTVKWKRGDYGSYQGYNLKYDNNNRLTSAVFGEGDNLASYKNYYDEYAEYDCNGNITRMDRRGLVDNMHGGFGFVDNLRMTYEGNMLTSVRDNASRMAYAGATDFDGVSGQEYPLTYNDAGSLVSDAGRKIARIDYDLRNNPVRIQFTNGNVTKYVYSATGEKLRVIYQTAVPNITVAIGSTRELSRSEIQYTDSTDYLLGGSLTLKNGRIDKYLFDEGYCQAGENTVNVTQDYFTINYYDRDHLGNIRQVTRADRTKTGTVIQSMDYYPFGAQFCHSGTDNNVQPYRYNGKEYDKMHGLNTYDYGARQYNPVTARWDRIDPLCEKYYSISLYAYCLNNPVMLVDPDGKETKMPMPGIYPGVIIAGHHNIKTIAFYITHPRIASSIGSPNDKGTISNTASNFEINITKGTKGLEHGSPGDEGNAIRHTIWQAMITNNYGEEIASTVAYCHEDNWKLTNQETVFKNKEAGDTYVDLKNNAIGRYIGKNNPNATNKQLITKVMQHYQSKGLYVLKKEGDIWKPVLDKITQQQLKQAIQIIQTKNENGLAK